MWGSPHSFSEQKWISPNELELQIWHSVNVQITHSLCLWGGLPVAVWMRNVSGSCWHLSPVGDAVRKIYGWHCLRNYVMDHRIWELQDPLPFLVHSLSYTVLIQDVNSQLSVPATLLAACYLLFIVMPLCHDGDGLLYIWTHKPKLTFL